MSVYYSVDFDQLIIFTFPKDTRGPYFDNFGNRVGFMCPYNKMFVVEYIGEL